MAWTKVQSAASDGAPTGGGPWTLAFPSAVTAGNLLVAVVGSDNATMTVDDATGHNTWAVVRNQADGANDQKTQMAYAIAQVSESVTVRLATAGAFRTFIIEEWSHTGGGTIALDQQNGEGLNAQTDPVTPSITPTADDALVLAATQGNGSSLIGSGEVSAPFTFEDSCSQTAGNPGNENTGVASRQQATAASISATFHFGGSQSTSTIIASFLATVSGALTEAGAPIAFDAATESVRTGTTDPHTFTHTGRAEASGGVQGIVVVVIHGTSSTDHVVGITYGGVALRRIQTAIDTTTEPGRADIWFLGERLRGLGGAQTVSVDLSSATTDDIEITAITLTTNDGSEVQVLDSGIVQDNVANPSVSLAYNGHYGIAIAGLYGGGAAPSSFTPNANCVEVASEDLGNFYAFVLRQTTPAVVATTFAIGGTAASDDVAYVAAAFARRQFRKSAVAFQDPGVF